MMNMIYWKKWKNALSGMENILWEEIMSKKI